MPMAAAMLYMPAVRCRRCGRPATVSRSHDIRTGARTVRVRCHGAMTEVPFATEPGTTIEVFGEEPKPAEPEPAPAPPTSTESPMQDIQGLAGDLGDMLASLNADAKAARDRLAQAKAAHGESTARVHRVADVIETATRQTNDLLNQMMGGNNPPA